MIVLFLVLSSLSSFLHYFLNALPFLNLFLLSRILGLSHLLFLQAALSFHLIFLLFRAVEIIRFKKHLHVVNLPTIHYGGRRIYTQQYTNVANCTLHNAAGL